jgi:arsenate reductase-like glutaredoxin family protein
LEQVDAKKAKLGFAEAKRLLKGIEDLYAAKGKKVVHLDLRQGLPSDADLEAVMLGPTGNLRAPALRTGKALLIGFEAGMYQELLGGKG